MPYTRKSKKKKLQIDSAVVHIQSSFNNTLATASTMSGDVLGRSSAGALGFKGSRKGTPYAGTRVGSELAKEMQAYGVKNIECNLKGPGPGRDSVVRALQSAGFNVTVLRDVTPLPHNGCRPPKKRRV